MQNDLGSFIGKIQQLKNKDVYGITEGQDNTQRNFISKMRELTEELKGNPEPVEDKIHEEVQMPVSVPEKPLIIQPKIPIVGQVQEQQLPPGSFSAEILAEGELKFEVPETDKQAVKQYLDSYEINYDVGVSKQGSLFDVEVTEPEDKAEILKDLRKRGARIKVLRESVSEEDPIQEDISKLATKIITVLKKSGLEVKYHPKTKILVIGDESDTIRFQLQS